jgi:hypothetical protein
LSELRVDSEGMPYAKRTSSSLAIGVIMEMDRRATGFNSAQKDVA